MVWIGGEFQPTIYLPIVEDYFNKKLLAKLGYSFDGAEISDLEVEAYNVIAVEAGKLEKADMEKESRKRGKNGK